MRITEKEVGTIPKKRKSGGKTGSRKGSYGKVQCSKCGRLVARVKNTSFLL